MSKSSPSKNSNHILSPEENHMSISKSKLESISKSIFAEKLLQIPCSLHKPKILDQICTKISCEFADERRLFCSQCVLSNEIHVKAHRAGFVDLGTFLQARLEEIEGKSMENDINLRINELERLKAEFSANVQNTCEKARKDFETFSRSLLALSQEIVENIIKKTQNSLQNFLEFADEQLFHLNAVKIRMTTEQSYIFNDLGRFLTIIQPEKEAQVNEFLKNFLKYKSKFAVEEEFMLLRTKSFALEQEVKRRKLFRSEKFGEFCRDVLETLQHSHYNDNKFLDFPEISSLNFTENMQIFESPSHSERKFANSCKNSNNTVDFSLKSRVNTENHMGILCLAVDNSNNFLFTSGVDKSIRVWLFNEKPVFILLDVIRFLSPILSMRFSNTKNSLFIAAGQEIKELKVEKGQNSWIIDVKNSVEAHHKIIKSIEIYEKLDKSHILISLSQDLTIKVWSVDALNLLQTLELGSEFRFICKDLLEKRTILGSSTGFIQIYDFLYPSLKLKREKQVFKQAVTAISFLNDEKVLFGSQKGRIKGFLLDSFEIFVDIKDINRGTLIYGILPIIESSSLIVVFSWGGEIGLWSLENKKKIGNCLVNLRNNNEKHINFQGVALFQAKETKNMWVFTSGNDDKFVEVIELSTK